MIHPIVERSVGGMRSGSTLDAFRRIVRDSPLAMVIQRADFRIVDCNRAYAALVGRSGDELIGLDPIAWATPSARASMRRHRQAIGRNIREGGEQLRSMIRPDGVQVALANYFQWFEDDDGSLLSLTTLVDRTRELKAIEDVRRQGETISLIFERAPIGMVTRDRNGCTTFVNQVAADLAGRSITELAGSRQLFAEERPAVAAEHHSVTPGQIGAGAGAGASPGRETRRVRSHDGRDLLIDTWNRRIDLFDGLAHELSILIDATAEHRLSEELARVVRQQSALLQAMAGCVMYVESGMIVRASAAVRRLFGTDPASLAGRPISSLFADAADWDELLWRHRRRLEPKDHAGMQAVVIGAEGNLLTCDVQIALVDPAEQALGWVVSIHDISDYKRAEALRVAELVAQREALIREVNHRIKNNLQGVAGLLEQFASQRYEAADTIREAASQVLAIATVHGLQLGEAGLVNFDTLIDAIISSLRRSFAADIIRVPPVVSCASDQKSWRLDEREAVPVALVINELVTNAIKHRSEGTVSITCLERDEGLVLEIRNRGAFPPGFDFDALSAASVGLGLVKALIPKRGARLRFTKEQSTVCVTVTLFSPVAALA